ncbi:MAG: sulfite exporter TauE/SafE family protein [Acidobacteria bacterium]|nr:sulfite exporter TauE/SafE family protein [Acidobacteriota bacterium]
MWAKPAIFAALSAFTLAYATVWILSLRTTVWLPRMSHVVTGFVTNFFDTLGIGSFATTTAIFKFRQMVPDQWIPGTMNAGHTLPTIFQAFIYISAIEVDVATLLLLIGGATVGAWFGAGLVAKLDKRTVQFAMGGTLLVAAVALLMRQLDLFPVGGEALQLRGWPLAVGVIGNFLFGAISTLGIGFYAPCMTMVSLLGMNPAAAFPIMMGSSAFLMPVASTRFVRSGAYLAPVATGLAIGGLLGVPLAAFVVKSLDLTALRWLVLVVILYAALLMLRSARQR